MNLSKFLTEKQVAQEFGLGVVWLRMCRQRRTGISFIKVGRKVLYDRVAVEKFIAGCVVEVSNNE